jgi:D-glycero-D-manno-heptose 1,7-bisphosphate phosphatase
MAENAYPAVFLDRDGTINEEVGYLSDIAELRFIPGVVRAITDLNKAGFKLIVVTNQAGVAKAFYSESALQALHTEMAKRLAEQGAYIDAFYYCPHHPVAVVDQYRQDCHCRKPMPGMLLTAAERHGIDLARSYMIGDKQSDMQAGSLAGCTTILVRTGYGITTEQSLFEESVRPAFIAADLQAASHWILHHTI